MSSSLHMVDRMDIDLEFRDPRLRERGEHEIASWIRDELLPSLEEALEEFDDPHRTITLDHLEIDLGHVGEYDFRIELPKRLKRELGRRLRSAATTESHRITLPDSGANHEEFTSEPPPSSERIKRLTERELLGIVWSKSKTIAQLALLALDSMHPGTLATESAKFRFWTDVFASCEDPALLSLTPPNEDESAHLWDSLARTEISDWPSFLNSYRNVLVRRIPSDNTEEHAPLPSMEIPRSSTPAFRPEIGSSKEPFQSDRPELQGESAVNHLDGQTVLIGSATTDIPPRSKLRNDRPEKNESEAYPEGSAPRRDSENLLHPTLAQDIPHGPSTIRYDSPQTPLKERHGTEAVETWSESCRTAPMVSDPPLDTNLGSLSHRTPQAVPEQSRLDERRMDLPDFWQTLHPEFDDLRDRQSALDSSSTPILAKDTGEELIDSASLVTPLEKSSASGDILLGPAEHRLAGIFASPTRTESDDPNLQVAPPAESDTRTTRRAKAHSDAFPRHGIEPGILRDGITSSPKIESDADKISRAEIKPFSPSGSSELRATERLQDALSTAPTSEATLAATHSRSSESVPENPGHGTKHHVPESVPSVQVRALISDGEQEPLPHLESSPAASKSMAPEESGQCERSMDAEEFEPNRSSRTLSAPSALAEEQPRSPTNSSTQDRDTDVQRFASQSGREEQPGDQDPNTGHNAPGFHRLSAKSENFAHASDQQSLTSDPQRQLDTIRLSDAQFLETPSTVPCASRPTNPLNDSVIRDLPNEANKLQPVRFPADLNAPNDPALEIGETTAEPTDIALRDDASPFQRNRTSGAIEASSTSRTPDIPTKIGIPNENRIHPTNNHPQSSETDSVDLGTVPLHDKESPNDSQVDPTQPYEVELFGVDLESKAANETPLDRHDGTTIAHGIHDLARTPDSDKGASNPIPSAQAALHRLHRTDTPSSGVTVEDTFGFTPRNTEVRGLPCDIDSSAQGSEPLDHQIPSRTPESPSIDTPRPSNPTHLATHSDNISQPSHWGSIASWLEAMPNDRRQILIDSLERTLTQVSHPNLFVELVRIAFKTGSNLDLEEFARLADLGPTSIAEDRDAPPERPFVPTSSIGTTSDTRDRQDTTKQDLPRSSMADRIDRERPTRFREEESTPTEEVRTHPKHQHEPSRFSNPVQQTHLDPQNRMDPQPDPVSPSNDSDPKNFPNPSILSSNRIDSTRQTTQAFSTLDPQAPTSTAPHGNPVSGDWDTLQPWLATMPEERRRDLMRSLEIFRNRASNPKKFMEMILEAFQSGAPLDLEEIARRASDPTSHDTGEVRSRDVDIPIQDDADHGPQATTSAIPQTTSLSGNWDSLQPWLANMSEERRRDLTRSLEIFRNRTPNPKKFMDLVVEAFQSGAPLDLEEFARRATDFTSQEASEVRSHDTDVPTQIGADHSQQAATSSIPQIPSLSGNWDTLLPWLATMPEEQRRDLTRSLKIFRNRTSNPRKFMELVLEAFQSGELLDLEEFARRSGDDSVPEAAKDQTGTPDRMARMASSSEIRTTAPTSPPKSVAPSQWKDMDLPKAPDGPAMPAQKERGPHPTPSGIVGTDTANASQTFHPSHARPSSSVAKALEGLLDHLAPSNRTILLDSIRQYMEKSKNTDQFLQAVRATLARRETLDLEAILESCATTNAPRPSAPATSGAHPATPESLEAAIRQAIPHDAALALQCVSMVTEIVSRFTSVTERPRLKLFAFQTTYRALVHEERPFSPRKLSELLLQDMQTTIPHLEPRSVATMIQRRLALPPFAPPPRAPLGSSRASFGFGRSVATPEGAPVRHAGLVLTAPYLPRLFAMLEHVAGNAFPSDAHKTRALRALHYLVAGHDSPAQDHDYALAKVLCGLPPEFLPVDEIRLTPKEMETCDQLLGGIIQNWSALGKTSPQGLRETFLDRDGTLHLHDESWHLRIPSKAFDVLVDRIPWGFSMVRYPWMEFPLQTKWRDA